jgi:transposase
MAICNICVDMHIVKSKFKSASGKIYFTVLLRESYREAGKVKKRTVANLSSCSPEEIAAIELALKHKRDLTALDSMKNMRVEEGLSIGSVFVILEMAKRLGIVDALGTGRQGQLALWQVIARVLEQGSRLSAVRLAITYGIASAIGLEKGFCEDDLYPNLAWLADNQDRIEDAIFCQRTIGQSPTLFLYDVTSSYLEGECNELGEWGYNRDKKKGKKQIVVGLLCDDAGMPVTTEVFRGNTRDTTTFQNQVLKAKQRFGCESVTFIGDRGMIKSGQIQQLARHGFHFITALTKAQIETLIKKQVIEYTLFDESIIEVSCDGIRYIIRRNPVRAQELAQTRASKLAYVKKLMMQQNLRLQEHPKAKASTSIKKIESKLKQLLIHPWVSIQTTERHLKLEIDQEALTKESKLDGCYVLKTDLLQKDATAAIVHARYKDLALVEDAFRTIKSDIEIRPIHVHKEESTRGHVLVVMLAYMIHRALSQAWETAYLTTEEALRSLSTICLQKVCLENGLSFDTLTVPRHKNQLLLKAVNVHLPKIIPLNYANVVTRKSRRKSALRP